MYLFFDTETTGLPKNWKAPVTDTNNWPRMVQLAWLIFNERGEQIDAQDFIIKPNGFTIPTDASRVHGITTERAMEEGKDLEFVLDLFDTHVQKASVLVAHNMNFDERIIGCEFVRSQRMPALINKKRLCTMNAATDYCRIPGPYGFKWPKLSELHIKLFGEDFEEAHNAAADINATAKCFWAMKEKGII